jgi:hypothetical protein
MDFWQGLICGLLIGGGAVSGYWLLIAHKVVPL